MGQSESSEFGCDKCQETILGKRFHCFTCEDFDMCEECYCKHKNEKIGVHESSHKMVRMFSSFPIDLVTVVVQYTDVKEIQEMLLLSHFFYDSIMMMNIPSFERNLAVLERIPTSKKRFIGILDVNGIKEFSKDISCLFPNLVSLDIDECTRVEDNAFEYLPKLRNIVMMYSIGFTGSGFRHLENLKSLDIEHSSFIEKENIIHDRTFEHLSHLEELHLRDGKLHQTDGFRNLRSLRKLTMTRVNGKTESLWTDFFRNLNHIEELDLKKCTFSPKSLQYLINLKTLNVSVSNIRRKRLEFRMTKEIIEMYIPKECDFHFAKRQYIFVGI